MKLFSEWELEESRRRQAVSASTHKKVASVAHADIDRWLKSVDGLAKDLQDLKAVKIKVIGKMDQIGQKFKSQDEPIKKEKEKEKDDDKSSKPVKRSRPQADREILSLQSEPEDGRKPESRRKQPNEPKRKPESRREQPNEPKRKPDKSKRRDSDDRPVFKQQRFKPKFDDEDKE